MAKSGILKQFKFQGKNLNAAQKAYNKAVDRAWRRIKYMTKKYGIEASLPSLPGTTYEPAIEQATHRLEDIRTETYRDPVRLKETADKFIRDFIADIEDYISYVDRYSSLYESVWRYNEDRAARWSKRMVASVKAEIDYQGEVNFYNRILNTEVATKLKAISQEIYMLPSDDKVESASTALFVKFLDTLRGSPLNMEEIKNLTGDDDSDEEWQQFDIESWEESMVNAGYFG